MMYDPVFSIRRLMIVLALTAFLFGLAWLGITVATVPSAPAAAVTDTDATAPCAGACCWLSCWLIAAVAAVRWVVLPIAGVDTGRRGK